MSKKKKEKSVDRSNQNRYYKSFAESKIESFSEEEKIAKLEELEEQGYEYNNGIHVLAELETPIPYDFILYCLLVEDLKKIPDN